MAKYYIDTEFLEGPQTKRFLGMPIGKTWKFLDAPYIQTKPTIDLISIALVAEDNREYYAISKDFNLKEAWNRYDLKERKDYENFSIKERGSILYSKDYWIRENVLKPIFVELHLKDLQIAIKAKDILKEQMDKLFTYKNFKKLINKYGKSNKQIAEEVKEFVYSDGDVSMHRKFDECHLKANGSVPEFYAYYADYDWVVFCWLFGRMIDLPKGFPMYCKDLKQSLDDLLVQLNKFKNLGDDTYGKIDWDLKKLKSHPKYPKQENEHNALADAIWNKKLHEFIVSL